MTEPNDTPLVGADVPDQASLRANVPVRDLDEFLEFLDRLRVLTPHQGTATRPPTTGDRFLL